jgi:hypothetical protein
MYNAARTNQQKNYQMSKAQYFKEFCDNLIIGLEKRSIISTRYKAITKRLNTDFWNSPSETLCSIFVGSYGRNTSIKNESDFDMIFVLPAHMKATYDKYTYNGQSALLQTVSKSIQKTYSTSKVGADGQVVAVTFTDGVNFEVVPAFKNYDNSYIFPDANDEGSWRKTKPHLEINKINEEDPKLNYNLKRLCKITRAWKGFCDVPIGGLLIDTLAYNFLKNWTHRIESYSYYDLMAIDFFEYLKNQNEIQEYWHALGSNQLIKRKGNFEYKAKLAYCKAVEAMQLQKNNKEWSAKQKWREIYGYEFPS